MGLFAEAIPAEWQAAWLRGDPDVDARLYGPPTAPGAWRNSVDDAAAALVLPRDPGDTARQRRRAVDAQLLKGMRVKKQHEVCASARPGRGTATCRV